MINKTNLQKANEALLNTYSRPDFILSHGNGMYLFDTEGKKYLDFVAGIAVNALGYNDKGMVKIIQDQAAKLIHCSNLYHTAPQLELANLLVEKTFADRAFFCNSGTEAIEGSLKFARKWGQKEKGEKILEEKYQNAQNNIDDLAILALRCNDHKVNLLDGLNYIKKASYIFNS